MQQVNRDEHRATAHTVMEVSIQRVSAQHPEPALLLIEEYYDALGVVHRDSREALLQYIQGPESAAWIAHHGVYPIGCVMLRRLSQFKSAGEIKRLYVRPSYRGLGAASLLLQTLEQFAQEQDLRWLYLDSKEDLQAAIAFYERHGYSPCPRYNENPQATIFMRKELPVSLVVRPFQNGDEKAFQALNAAWIEKYFKLEEKDQQTLNDPQRYILSQGGQIFMALLGGEPVGCCALSPRNNGTFELAKMAVSEQEQGKGIGRKLLTYAVEYARAQGVPRLYLGSNTSLASAIHLYESVGFRHIPPERIEVSPYTRANVHMELFL